MAEMIQTIEHLSSEIGPRPVATEEEQQAALYIARQLDDLGLPAEIEEFQGSVSHKKTRLACSAVAVILAIVSLFVPVMALPAVIGSFLCAVLFASEEMGRPVLSKFLDKGISQNVVARYVPESEKEGKGRRRKIILVSRIDSGSVRPELNPPFLVAMPILAKASKIGMVVLPLFLLVKSLFFLHATGVAFIITTILLIIVCLCAALPAISFVMEKAAGLNDGANSSASGVAVMLEVARRISESASEETPVVHGAQAAYEAGAVPDGAQLLYEQAAIPEKTMPNAPDQPLNEMNSANSSGVFASAGGAREFEAQPAAASAASIVRDGAFDGGLPNAASAVAAGSAAVVGGIAAVANAANATSAVAASGMAGNGALNNAGEVFVQPAEQGADVAPAVQMPEGVSGQVDGQAASSMQENTSKRPNEVPSWFSAGRAAARRNESAEDSKPVKRSTFATALEAAEQRLNDVSRETSPSASAENDYAMPLDQQFKRNFAAVRGEQTTANQMSSARESAQTASADQGFQQMPAVAQTAPGASYVPPSSFLAAKQADSVAQGVAEANPSATFVQAAPVEASPEDARFGDSAAVQPSAANDVSQQASSEENVPEPEVEILPPVGEEASEGASAEPAAISMDYFMAAAVGARAGDTVVAQAVVTEQERQPLSLPDLSVTGTLPVVDVQKQRAPLAEAEEASENAAKSLLTRLPSLDVAETAQSNLRASIPSLSGVINRVPETQAFEPVAGATGSFAPVTEALALNIEDDEELFVDDVDESAFDKDYTDTGAYAGPEYVDMPKKRGPGIFDKLFGHKKKEEQRTSSHEWQNADDYDYEYDDDDYASFSSDEDDATWKGGAFSGKLSGLAGGAAGVASRVRGVFPGGKEEQADVSADRANARRNRSHRGEVKHDNEAYYDQQGLDDGNDQDDQEGYDEYSDTYADRAAENEEYARVLQLIADKYEPQESETADVANGSSFGQNDVDAAHQQIKEFRASGIDTEVWFVALGAETDCHAGMEEFIEAHRSDLRGAIIIELDSLGAGALSVIEQEGALKPVTTSSRMRRYAKHASQVSGVKVENGYILWGESAASTALRKGLQAMHLAGMDGTKPALYAQADDVLENIDQEILAENADFVIEVIKSI